MLCSLSLTATRLDASGPTHFGHSSAQSLSAGRSIAIGRFGKRHALLLLASLFARSPACLHSLGAVGGPLAQVRSSPGLPWELNARAELPACRNVPLGGLVVIGGVKWTGTA